VNGRSAVPWTGCIAHMRSGSVGSRAMPVRLTHMHTRACPRRRSSARPRCWRKLSSRGTGASTRRPPARWARVRSPAGPRCPHSGRAPSLGPAPLPPGRRQPAANSPASLSSASTRHEGYRLPRRAPQAAPRQRPASRARSNAPRLPPPNRSAGTAWGNALWQYRCMVHPYVRKVGVQIIHHQTFAARRSLGLCARSRRAHGPRLRQAGPLAHPLPHHTKAVLAATSASSQNLKPPRSWRWRWPR
jgi:hypothetical protein